ncbi:hypothetical protein DPEC_G00251230 [Dallia pectoralis]|uniref:Uncharacterized protein n=1 Tax=Dallia pectoralis TaxID=75939 RepID=A0ACC2FTG3_DALPE|nr:hypothetical protein DPEC_G00251230 [Dallia pectoralis]
MYRSSSLPLAPRQPLPQPLPLPSLTVGLAQLREACMQVCGSHRSLCLHASLSAAVDLANPGVSHAPHRVCILYRHGNPVSPVDSPFPMASPVALPLSEASWISLATWSSLN